jgi:hypothetical protein
MGENRCLSIIAAHHSFLKDATRGNHMMIDRRTFVAGAVVSAVMPPLDLLAQHLSPLPRQAM